MSSPRAILVTGASSGIGRAVALRFAAPGAELHLSARDPRALEAVLEEVRARGAAAHAHALDLVDPTSIEALAAELREVPLEVLVNNAGAAESAPFLRTDDALFERMLAINCTGPFRLTRALLPQLLARGADAAIICVASTAAKIGAPYVAAYTAAKHGLLGWMRSLAAEVAKKGLRVNAVCPGYVATPMTERTLANIQAKTGGAREQALEAILASSPQRRLVEADEVAALVYFLASREARSIHGQALAIDGGATS
ncbi:MAG: SDR family oxidoreductase [Planctomycetes bacterium]|nr:SDR family oxidoreductase [Planctomycetota bacterium]